MNYIKQIRLLCLIFTKWIMPNVGLIPPPSGDNANTLARLLDSLTSALTTLVSSSMLAQPPWSGKGKGFKEQF